MRKEPDQIAQDSLDADSFICERCSKININEILSLGTISGRGHLIFNFRSASEIVENPDCSFCQAFDFISPPSFAKPKQQLYCALMAVHSSISNLLYLNISQRIVLSEDSIVLTTKVQGRIEGHFWRMRFAECSLDDAFPGCLGLSSGLKKDNGLFTVDSIGSTVDFNMLRSWIKTCEKKHGNYCAPGSTQNSTLRLIECDSRRVVATPKSPETSTYAALSYVWGSQEPGEVCSEELSKQLPKTIEDAITVTKGLGIPYLWIDRYCINQDDEREKNNQCSLMHRIYENAHVTIIAAAGSGPDHGLPGIGSSTRSYPSVRIGSRLLVPTLPDPRLSIRAAKWSTRGWTYQESRLSKRRLIFTDRQVLFVCTRACTDEAEQKLKPDIELPDGDIRPSTSLYPFCMSGKFPYKVWDDINQFSNLDLSRQEDRLNAMLGILQLYQELDWQNSVHLRHLAGLPAIKKELSDYKRPEDHEYSTWAPAIFEGLCWMAGGATKMRDAPHPGFPSWSWTAWNAVQYRTADPLRRSFRYTSHWNKYIFVERPDGGLIRGNELDSLLEARHDFSRIRFIHLKAPSLNFTIFHFRNSNSCFSSEVWGFPKDHRCVVRHHDIDFVCHVKLADLNVHIPKDGLHCWGIMAIENQTPDGFNPTFLLVTKVEDWYERIGVAKVSEQEVLQKLEIRTFRLG